MNDAVAEATARLRAAGVESARLEARILWEYASNIAETVHPPLEGGSKREALRGGANTSSNPNPSPKNSSLHSNFSTLPQGEGAILECFQTLIARRVAHEPIAYITGEKEFWSLPFRVGPGCLIPRPETEILIQEAMREFPDHQTPLNILDLGTGSGCLLVTLLLNYPNARGTGIDLSAEALQWARVNAGRHGVASRSAWIQANWGELEQGAHDLVVANPPYVASEEVWHLSPDVREFEPESALNGGPDGLAAYRTLAPVLQGDLISGGRAFLEIGCGQAYMVAEILASQGLEVVRIVNDLAGTPRCVITRLPGEAGPGSSK